MEDKSSTESGSLGGHTESESPPPPAISSGGGGGVVPDLMNMDVNMSIESRHGVTIGGGGVFGSGGSSGGGVFGSGGSSGGGVFRSGGSSGGGVFGSGGSSGGGVFGSGGSSGDLLGKKKRGRPRKYDADGNLRVPYMASPLGSSPPPPGFYLSSPSSDFGSKRGRGRPPGSGNWQLLASLGELFAETAGGDFRPHVVTVYTGEDVAAKIHSFAQKGPRGICVLSANGAVSNVVFRQPGSSGGTLKYEGLFEILTLTGSFTINENGGVKSRTGGLSVSLAGPDGRVIGGGIGGSLMAAGPIQIVVGSFVPNGYKTHKRKHNNETRMPLLLQGRPETVIAANPISQAAPDGSVNPISRFPGQSLGEAGNNTSHKENTNSTSTGIVNRNGLDLMSYQRPSPDINQSLPVE